MDAVEQRPIVVVEDEPAILDVVEYNLVRAGHVVRHAADGRRGLDLIRSSDPRLVVLDVMLPELDGLAVCRALRADAATRHLPVIMLTARGDEADVVDGLDAGADDYVVKPFSPRELLARVNAVLRREPGTSRTAPAAPAAPDAPAVASRADADERSAAASLDGVTVDPARHEVLVDGSPVHLTRTELRLLHVLASRPGRVFTREELLVRVMGDDAWITDRTIDVHVRAIRRKLGARAGVVETIRGVGYRARDARRADA